MPPVQESLVRDLLQAPPDRLDIGVVIGDVGFVHVHPECDAVGHVLPFPEVLPDRLLALLDKGLDAIGLDLILAVDPQLLFHLKLDRQAVRVPSADAEHVLALHRLIAREQVLHRARQDVADVRLAVGGRRPLIEGEAFLALVTLQAFLHDPVLFPETGYLPFSGGEVHVA